MKKEIKDFCKRFNITEAQFLGKEKIEGDLYLSNNQKNLSANTKPLTEKDMATLPRNKMLSWENGKCIMADGMFTEVLSKKGNLYKVRQINKTKEFYLATDGNFFAHGDTAHKATEDLKFKVVAETLKSAPIKADTMISPMYYRTVTGACEFGTKAWLEQNNLTGIEEMPAKDLIKHLEKTNAYGLEKFRQLITF